MKAGLIVAGAPFCAQALFDRRAVADDEKLAEVTPIGPREIVKGLDGMSRVADTGNTFGLGHNAAAVISSAFFCHEQKLDADTQKEILAFLDARLLKNPIYAVGRPTEAADPKLTEGLLEDLDAGIATLRGKGHNIIFAVTSLKALRAVPEAVTPERVDGLRKMVRSFGKTRGGAQEDPEPPLVGLDDEQNFVHFIFEEFLKAAGDGFDGHVLTIGHALLELHRMGHKELARKGVPAYWEWCRGARAVADDGPGEAPPALPRAPTPLGREYWASQVKHRIGETASSHRVKYPYSFYALAKDVKDEDLKKRILAKVYRLTATN
jgi:hypothetical protein